MVGRWSLRTKLVALVLVPMVALGALAGWLVMGRLQAAKQAAEVRSIVDLAVDVAPVVDHLQRERSVVGARLFSDDGATRSRYELESAIADKTVNAFRDQVLKLRRGDTADLSGSEVGRALLQAAALSTIRAGVAAHSISSTEAQAAYTEAISRFLAVTDRLANATQDRALAERIDASLAAARAGEEVAKQSAALGGAYAAGDLDRATLIGLAASRRAEQTQLDELRRSATPAEQARLDGLLRDVTVTAADHMRDAAIAGDGSLEPSAAGIWRDSVARKHDGLARVGTSIREDLARTAAARETQGRRDAEIFAAAAGLAILFSLALAVAIARSIVRPVRRLTEAASEAAGRLPTVVEALAQPGADAITAPTAIAVRGPEMGRLAEAFNNVNRVAIDVAGEQAALRAGIAEMFTNVARRSQALVERQLGFIDSLEREERDPDVLQSLFRLDHLATRMRRNAESLLVLAGAEAPRRWRDPVLLRDIIRAAAGEVEDFSRVNVADTGWLALPGALTAGTIHLLAELIDNACRFSPPDTPVDVRVHELDGHYVVTIHDRGLGMSDVAMAAANEKLARPPLLEAAVTGQLGLFVAGRIAGRSGLTVRLTRSPWGGVSANLFVPSHLVLVVPETTPAPPAAASIPAAVAPPSASGSLLGPAPGSASPPEQRTSSGLARRVPKAADAATANGASAPAAPLAPEAVQATMARFQSGLARGRAAAAHADGTEGEER
jgi:signal transduction histidine kinase